MPKVLKTIFNAQSLEDAALTLSQHMPTGRAWAVGVEDSNINRLITSLAKNFQTVEELIEELAREFDINQTFDLIEEWEESVGLPDNCLVTTGPIEERRSQVLQRLRKEPVVSIGQMQALVDEAFPGGNIVLYTGTDYFNYEYTYEHSYIGNINERFILVAEVPFTNEYEYDYEFNYTSDQDTDKLRCIIEPILSANVVFHIEFVSTGG